MDRVRLLIACCATLVVAVSLSAGCPASPPADALQQAAVQADMEALIAHLDSSAYGKTVSWPQHVVLAYRLALDRDPTVAEFAIIQMLREHPGLKRSDVLGLALASESDDLSWEACAGVVARRNKSSFQPNADVTNSARRLFATPPEHLAAIMDEEAVAEEAVVVDAPKGTETPNENYGFYFGYLHAHSHLSLDGDGEPLDAYTTARESGMDFFSLSDHAEFLILWPWQNKWQQLRNASDATDVPGEFAALWGFEWSNPLLGHMSVFNTEDFTHTLKTFRLRAMYDWLAARPEGFAQYNHPGDYDFLGLEFGHFRPYPKATAQMVGLEIWNESRTFDQYFYNGSWDSDVSYMDVANQNGWRLGALGAQDNHRQGWGTMNDFRTGVLATELTREGISEAFRARRFYATEDKDLELDFRCNGFPMGSTVNSGTLVFTVLVHSRSGDSFAQARLYRDGIQVATEALEDTTSEATFRGFNEAGYYYVIVTQTDDNDNNGRNDEAISSPIWVQP